MQPEVSTRNPVGRGLSSSRMGGSAAGAAEKPARRGCCGCRGKGDPKYGMMPDDKRKCRDILGCILFLAFCESINYGYDTCGSTSWLSYRF